MMKSVPWNCSNERWVSTTTAKMAGHAPVLVLLEVSGFCVGSVAKYTLMRTRSLDVLA